VRGKIQWQLVVSEDRERAGEEPYGSMKKSEMTDKNYGVTAREGSSGTPKGTARREAMSYCEETEVGGLISRLADFFQLWGGEENRGSVTRASETKRA